MRKFLSLPVVDPLVRGKDPDPAPDSSIKKNSKKKCYFYWFVTSLSLFVFEE
jgi:hypothetical protein